MEARAYSLGASSFGRSKVKNKRYYVVYNGKIINFGQPGAHTYADGATMQKRDAYRARHRKIKLKDGSFAYKNKNQASFWAYRLLWT